MHYALLGERKQVWPSHLYFLKCVLVLVMGSLNIFLMASFSQNALSEFFQTVFFSSYFLTMYLDPPSSLC